MHPRLSRALYRNFLRASHHGKHPEVFGRHGAAVFAHQCHINKEHPSLALPSNPSQVRERLKEWFRHPPEMKVSYDTGGPTNDLLTQAKATPLAVMRKANELEALISNMQQIHHDNKLPLPIFEYDQIAALPGEQLETLFLEPRYVDGLLPFLLESTSSQRQFLLRANKHATSATVLTLLSHQYVTLPANTVGMGASGDDRRNGNDDMQQESARQRMISGVAVNCLAGSRVSIIQDEDIHGFSKQQTIDDLLQIIDGTHNQQAKQHCWSESSAPLSMATKVEPHGDTDSMSQSCNALHFEETRQHILNLIECVMSFHDKDLAETLIDTGFGLPPLEPEAISFWALRFVLTREDMPGRHFWLHNCQSTTERLQYVVLQIEAILDAQEEQEIDEEEERMTMARFA